MKLLNHILLILFTSTGIQLSASAIKKALITGITGQDGAYLAEFLLNKGYEVHGVKRSTSVINTNRIRQLYREVNGTQEKTFVIHDGDVCDSAEMLDLIKTIQPDEIYNLAAQSHVTVSFERPHYTTCVDALGPLNILDAIRILGLEKKTKFYQASTSELYGKIQETPQREETPFYPRSPYGVAKLYAYWITKNYRETYGIFAVNGILFNHESPHRGSNFVTKKIAKAAALIAQDKQECLFLGNLDSHRDWGHAQDYVEAMWLMLQQENPEDFVIATGQVHSVREFVELAFAQAGMPIKWEGEGVDEVGYDAQSGKKVVCVDKRYFRPSEVELLLVGDASKAKRILSWQPKVTFEQLVQEMVDYEINLVKKNGHGIDYAG